MNNKNNDNDKKPHSLWPVYLIFGSIGIYVLYIWSSELGVFGFIAASIMLYYAVKGIS